MTTLQVGVCRRWVRCCLAALVVLTLAAPAPLTLPLPLPLRHGSGSRQESKMSTQLAHMVFFTLKDHSQASREAFVASCHKYLQGHAGTVHYSVGIIAADVEEPVSVRDFDVALHLIFESKEAEARYLKDPRHQQFVEENRPRFERVRVFDTYLAAP